MKKLTLLLMIVLFLIAPSIVSAALSDNLVVYYNMNHSSGSAIDLISGFNLTNTNTITYNDGLVDNASDSGAANANKLLENTANPPFVVDKDSSWSVCWLFMRNGSASGNDNPLDIRTSTGNDNFFNSQVTAADEFKMQSGGGTQIVFAGILDKTWYHICASYTASSGVLIGYINGSNDANGTLPSNTAAGDSFTLFRDVGAGYFSGKVDEVAVWQRAITGDEVLSVYNNATAGRGYSWPAAPITNFSITADSTNGTTNIQIFNATINGTEWNTTNGIIQTEHPNGVVNITLHHSPGYRNLSYTDYNMSVDLVANLTPIIDNITYEFAPVIIQNTSQLFNFSFDYSAGYIGSILNATFRFNNTNTPANVSFGASDANFTVRVTMPSLNTSTNFNFTWTIEFNSSNGNFNDTRQNTTAVHFFDLDNCSVYTNVTLNISLFNENTTAPLISTLDMWMDITYSGILVAQNKSFSFAGATNYSICINPSNANATIDAQLEYASTGFDTKLYYLNDFFISNVTKQLDLFLTPSTTQVAMTVTDFDDDPVPGAIIKVLSYDFGNNSYLTTEILETDTSGVAHGQLVLNTKWYAFIIEVDGVVALSTLPAKVVSSALTFRIDLEDDYFNIFDTANGISSVLSYTTATSTFNFVFTDPSGSMTEACLLVEKQGPLGITLMNESCLSSTAGTILVTIYENKTDNTYMATGYVTIGDSDFVLQKLSESFNAGYKTYGLDGLFMTFLVVMTFALSQVWNPAVAVVFATIGVLISIVLGIFHLSYVIIGSFVIMAGITIYKMTRRG